MESIAAIGIAGIDHAADAIAVARAAVDVGDLHLAAPAVALGFLAAGIDRIGIVVAVLIAVVIAVAIAVIIERGDDRGDAAKDGDASDDVARVDAVVAIIIPKIRACAGLAAEMVSAAAVAAPARNLVKVFMASSSNLLKRCWNFQILAVLLPETGDDPLLNWILSLCSGSSASS